MPVNIERIIEKLFGQKLVRCTERFELTVANVSCIGHQLIAMAEITAKGGEEISGATMYAVHSADADDPRAFGAALGSGMGQPATFNTPFALTASLFPFDAKTLKNVIIIVAITTPGSDKMCFLDKELVLHH